MDKGSVTGWFDSLQAGHSDAAEKLWERFAGRLIGLARKRLLATRRGAADEEDAVLSAFDSFCRGAEQGRFPRWSGRDDDLWSLLAAITVRKVYDQINHEKRLKRGGGAVLSEAELGWGIGPVMDLNDLIGSEPTPEMAAEMAEQSQRLLEALARTRPPFHRLVEDGRFHERGDRRQARLRPEHGAAKAEPHSSALGGVCRMTPHHRPRPKPARSSLPGRWTPPTRGSILQPRRVG